ncbi:hypothetical protein BDQ17DRAFT_1432373 [Cyathus striatus]|nr:hypothetical protein BDQ17DRAFT_1432373 [Cyathus striatus]
MSANSDFSQVMMSDSDALLLRDYPEAYPDGTEEEQMYITVPDSILSILEMSMLQQQPGDEPSSSMSHTERGITPDSSSSSLTLNDDWSERELYLLSQKPRADNGGPRRPPNPWIIFRKERSRQLIDSGFKGTTGEMSKRLSQEWKQMDPIKKSEYRQLSHKGISKFKDVYPDYRYTRGPNGSRNKKAGSNRNRQNVQTRPIADPSYSPPIDVANCVEQQPQPWGLPFAENVPQVDHQKQLEIYLMAIQQLLPSPVL